MDLHGVPDIKPAGVTKCDEPEPRGVQRARQRPVGRSPHRIDNVRDRFGLRVRGRAAAIRLQADVFRALAQKEIDRHEHDQSENAHGRAGGAPSRVIEGVLHPRQQRHRADADAAERNADRQAAPAHEPVRQEQRLSVIADAVAAGADHEADGRVEMPWLARQRRQQQAQAHQYDADLDHHARPGTVHQAADQRTEKGGNEEAERERACGDAALPAEFRQDRREEQRERSAHVHPDGHGDKGDGDDDPAVEKGEARFCGHECPKRFLQACF